MTGRTPEYVRTCSVTLSGGNIGGCLATRPPVGASARSLHAGREPFTTPSFLPSAAGRQREPNMRHLVPPLLLALLIALFASTPAHAQFTLKGGINLVDLFGGDVAASDTRPRLAGGVAFDIIGIGPLKLAPEIYYAQKGAENFQSRLAAGEAAHISLAYVEVPVLLRLTLPFGGPRVEPYVAGGPVFGWQLDCNVTVSADDVVEDCGQLLGGPEGVEDTLRSFEQGIMVGAGLIFEVIPGIGAITVDARYARGLTRLSEDADGPEIQNRAVSVLLGYRFGLR
jgi:hypothetical protein